MDLLSIKELQNPAATKTVLLVLDGLGGLPLHPGGDTELETAATPNMDKLAELGLTGLHIPVNVGVTPGSGPGHLALFGYDPLFYDIGRGALSALGVNFDLQPDDVAARGNFCSVDENGVVTDRRAARIGTEECRRLCDVLRQIHIDGVEIHIQPVKEHRFLFVLRGEGLSGELTDQDPLRTGVPPNRVEPNFELADYAAGVVNQFTEQAAEALGGERKGVLLRGFSQRPDWPVLPDIYGIRCAAIAGYPMYRGVARLLGMDVLKTDQNIENKLDVLARYWNEYDFFFVHVKAADSRGEDGDFAGKVEVIEGVDAALPKLLALEPDVLTITGDHSTPAAMRAHSWHPVPVLMYGKLVRRDDVAEFGERACMRGGLSTGIHGCELMPLMMAHAGRLKKYGA